MKMSRYCGGSVFCGHATAKRAAQMDARRSRRCNAVLVAALRSTRALGERARRGPFSRRAGLGDGLLLLLLAGGRNALHAFLLLVAQLRSMRPLSRLCVRATNAPTALDLDA